MSRVNRLNHPLALSLLTKLRDKQTNAPQFRSVLGELTRLLVYEATSDWECSWERLETPVAECKAPRLVKPLALVSILRAGEGMMRAASDLISDAKLCHVGLYRDEKTLRPVIYYQNIPDLSDHEVIILDPMLATGHSALAALNLVSKTNPYRIKLVSVIASPEGIELIQANKPDVQITVAAVDPELNESGFIVPGLGDAGDRIFNTRQEDANPL